jgi:hypothetical protein
VLCSNIIFALLAEYRLPLAAEQWLRTASLLALNVSSDRWLTCSRIYSKVGSENRRFPAQSEQVHLIFEGVETYPTVLILRRVIKRARRTRLRTHIMGRARTWGMFGSLPIDALHRGNDLVGIRSLSSGREPAQQCSPKPFNLVGSGFLNLFDIARLIGFLVLPKVQRVVEQKTDLGYGRRPVRKFVAVEEQRLIHRRDVEFFINLGGTV